MPLEISDILAIWKALEDGRITYLRARIDSDTRQEIIIDGIIISKTRNEQMPIEQEDEGNWLEKCVPFEGIEADIPDGIIGLPAGIFAEELIKSVIVFDDNTEDGLAEIKRVDLKGNEDIVNVKFWEARIAALLTGSGIWIVDVNGKKMSREDWFNSISPVTGVARQTDGLAIFAMKKLNWLSTGGGVQVQTPPGKKFGVDATKIEGVGQQRTHGGPEAVPLGKY